MESNGKPIRWWPLWLIIGLALGAGLLGNLIFDGENHRQGMVMGTMAIGLIALGLIQIWMLFFSRMRWFWRLGGFAGTFVLLFLFASSVEYGGVSGDLIPIIRLKGSSETSGSVVSVDSNAEVSTDGLKDYSQFLGPDRNAKLEGISLSRDWEANPPQLLWRQPIGEAWSAFSISGSRAVTQEQAGELEQVRCYEALTGKLLWNYEYKARYYTEIGGAGPRATPTIDGEFVYTLGSTGVLNCLKLESGEAVWSHNILEDHGGIVPEWGLAGSPLVEGDLVIVSAGGPEGKSLVAYNKISGDFVWGGGSDNAHYSSPVVFDMAGKKQVLIFNMESLAAHDLDTGKVLWNHALRPERPHVCLPVLLLGDRILISSGYGNGSDLLQVSKDDMGGVGVELLWKSMHLKAKFTNVVYKDGYIYGLDDGMMTCVDIETGKRTWKKDRLGHGQMILVGDVLLVTSEQGEVLMYEPNPEECRVLGRFQAFEGKSWNPPALAGEYLFVRNHLKAACYRLAVE